MASTKPAKKTLDTPPKMTGDGEGRNSKETKDKDAVKAHKSIAAKKEVVS